MSVFFSNIYNKMCWTSVWYICTSLGHNNIVLCIPNCVYIVYARFTHEFCTHSSHYYIWYCTHWRFLWSYHHYDTLHVCNHYRVHCFYHLSSPSVFLTFLFIIDCHIDCDNHPCTWNDGTYLSMYHLLRVLSHPGSWDPCMPWNAPYIPVYQCVLMHDLQLHAVDWTARMIGANSCLPWRLSKKTGRWMRRQ